VSHILQNVFAIEFSVVHRGRQLMIIYNYYVQKNACVCVKKG